ncbi:MAG: hypothetical protein SO238_03585 [Treponema sp.]|nr:hypothetical protein [Treponema sp.]
MSKKAVSIYMAATCAISIITPGRFVCGIVVAVEICLLMLLGTLFRTLIEVLKLNKMKQPLILIFVVYFTSFYKRFVILFMPELGLQLGFIMFLPAISTFTTVFLMDEKKLSLINELTDNMPCSLLFSLYVLIISFIRDFLAFGTITLPGTNGFYEYIIFDTETVSAASFLATIPGALILSAILLSFYLFIEKKFHIILKAGIK